MSLLVSRRRAVSLYPREGAKKELTFNGLQGPGQAVPTGEAHRLPKSVAYLSAPPREVKTVAEESAMAQAHARNPEGEAGSRQTRFEL